MRTLYATGISGTIGKHLPNSVCPISLNLTSSREEFRDIKIESDSNLLHLAGIVGPAQVEKDIQYAHKVNVDGVKLLANEFLHQSAGKFFYVSTSHVYAQSSDLLTESSLIRPINLYAEQKREAEIALESIFAGQLERLSIIRVFSVLDWDTAPFTLGGAIRNLAVQDPFFVLRNAADVRDFLTPKTIATALYAISSQSLTSGVVNLCSGVGNSVGDAAERMLEESGFKLNKSQLAWENSSTPFAVGDNSRLESLVADLKLTWIPNKITESELGLKV